MFELHETLAKLRQQLLPEAATGAPLGTVLRWKAPGGNAFGVKIGMDGKDVLALTIYDQAMKKDRALKLYRDEALSDKLGPVMPHVIMSVQRVPAAKAFRYGRIRGAALAPYTQAAKQLQGESIEIEAKVVGLGELGSDPLIDGEALRSFLESKWTQRALKKDPEPVGLPIQREGFGGAADVLRKLREAMEPDLTEEEMAENLKAVLHWVKQKHGAAKMKAHRAFVKMVRKNPAAHRLKMRQDARYHRIHKWHASLMKRTSRPGWVRRHIRSHADMPDGPEVTERGPGQAFMDLPFELRVTEKRSSASMKVQTLLFSKSHFDRGSAVKWAKSHGFKAAKVDEKENTLRIRQRAPGQFETFRTISFKPGIKAVVAKQ